MSSRAIVLLMHIHVGAAEYDGKTLWKMKSRVDVSGGESGATVMVMNMMIPKSMEDE